MLNVIKHFVIVFIIFLAVKTHAIESLKDIQVGGTYRMELTTGDILEGIVEEKSETSLIIACKGEYYTFKKDLILKYELISTFKKRYAPGVGEYSFDELLRSKGAVGRIQIRVKSGKVFKGTVSGINTESVKIDVGGSIIPISRDIIAQILKITAETDTPEGPEIFSFDELLYRKGNVGKIQIRVKGGRVFKGIVSSIDKETVRIDVGGSVIPISRDIITKISRMGTDTKDEKTKIPEGPFDTVFVLNPATDEHGIHAPPLQVVGKILKDNLKGVSLTTLTGAVKMIRRDHVLRVYRHSPVPYEEVIKEYRKSLSCPNDMILIDIPPGKVGRPLIKVCIDRYEYPNEKGVVPYRNIPYTGAQNLCKKKGKRLCTIQEWQWACSGLEGHSYPYGVQINEHNCNTEGQKNVEPSGSRIKCVGEFRVFDMVGNLFEWVTDSRGRTMIMGGPTSKCQDISPGMKGAAKPQIGFRCCKSN